MVLCPISIKIDFISYKYLFINKISIRKKFHLIFYNFIINAFI